jgi:Fe-S cluster assembly protein SufD
MKMATQVAQEQNTFGAAFLALQEAESVPRLKGLRESAMRQFEETGFPTVRDEEWKYTNVAPIARAGFEPAAARTGTPTLDAGAADAFTYAEAARSQLIFVNGIFRPDSSSLEALPRGVLAMSLADALKDERWSETALGHLGRVLEENETPLATLNRALISDGAFIYVPRGVRVESPIHLLFLSEPRQAAAASFPRVLIVAEQGSEATVIESFAGLGEGAYWTNAVTEINVGEGARLDLYTVQREGAQGFHTATTSARVGRAAGFNSTAVTLGAALSRHDINVAFAGEGAECWVDGLYIVGDGQHTDTHSQIDHRVPRCTSHQLYKGILDGKSRAVFNGKVFVREGAQQTDAHQTNRNLLLSNEARVDTKPQLEIFADDVKCAHGATVGQLEEEELFYLESRGLHADLARNLLTYGFAEEVIDKIKIESIRAQLDEAVLNRLRSRLEA